ncbi:uncharacterized protein LOC143034671 [Oratosquilla oratoria]|uniref:uncharacterized protein LOC143034671 n=1 Tax=Oratosquilla oratoria TaxID=337810 RepID=UPI003F7781BC
MAATGNLYKHHRKIIHSTTLIPQITIQTRHQKIAHHLIPPAQPPAGNKQVLPPRSISLTGASVGVIAVQPEGGAVGRRPFGSACPPPGVLAEDIHTPDEGGAS